MGFLVSQRGPIGCDTPSPFSERFPLGEHAKWRCDTPLLKGISAIPARYPMKQGKWVRYPPLRYYLERVLRDMGGGVSRTGPLSLGPKGFFRFKRLKRTLKKSRSGGNPEIIGNAPSGQM